MKSYSTEPKKSAVIIIPNGKGLFLCVRSHKRFLTIGFPGGKIEENETPTKAIIRETKEETGLNIRNNTRYLGKQRLNNQEIFLFTVKEIDPEWRPKSSDEGVTEWTRRKNFFGKESFYPEFNKWAFEKYDE